MKEHGLVLLTLITCILLSAAPSALAASDCPGDTFKVAKAELNETGGVTIFDHWECQEDDDMDCSDINDSISSYIDLTLTGFNKGTWDSSPYRIAAVVYKIDGPDVEDPVVTYDPWNTSDSFDYSNYNNAISHMEFCAASSPPPVPELPTIALTTIGLLGLLFFYRRSG